LAKYCLLLHNLKILIFKVLKGQGVKPSSERKHVSAFPHELL